MKQHNVAKQNNRRNTPTDVRHRSATTFAGRSRLGMAFLRILMAMAILAAAFVSFDIGTYPGVAQAQEPVVDVQSTLAWRLADSFYPEIAGATTQDEGASYVAYSSDGALLAVGAASGLNVYTTVDLGETLTVPLASPVTALAYSPSGKLLAVGMPGGNVDVRDASNGDLIQELVALQGSVNALAFSPDGTLLAAAVSDGSVRLWRLSDGSLVNVMKGNNTGAIADVDFTPDGTLVAGAGADGSTNVWRVSNGSMLSSLVGASGGVAAVDFAPDGETIAVGSGGGNIWLWAFKTADSIRSLPGLSASITDLDFSLDGTALVVSAADGTMAIIDVANEITLQTLRGSAGFTSMSVSPAGAAIATGGIDGTVSLWEAYLSPVTGLDDAAFVADVSIPDYTQMSPGTQFQKIWRMENTGVSTWNQDYALQFVAGDAMGTPIPQAIPVTQPGQTADIQVGLQAPAVAGTYRSVWQLINAQGQAFGPRITVVIDVVGTGSTTPAAYRLELTSSADVGGERRVGDARRGCRGRGECVVERKPASRRLCGIQLSTLVRYHLHTRGAVVERAARLTESDGVGRQQRRRRRR